MRSATSYALLAFLSTSRAYFILSHPLLVATREDPIVNPGSPSAHEHTVVGGSQFDLSVDYDKLISSQCTTAPVSVDKSAYWTPSLYYYNPLDQTFQGIELGYVNTYYLNRPGKDGKVSAPPKGLRMIVGNPYRRVYNPANTEDRAISFVCLGEDEHRGDPAYNQRHDFFSHQCKGGIRMQANFPNCWDGVNLDSPDHKSHMAFSSGGPDGNGECPSSHPIKIVEIFYEFIYKTGDYPFNDASVPTWCLANGDCTGLGFHADFVMGWQDAQDGTSVLQAAIDQCNVDYHDGKGPGIGGVLTDCPPFVPYLQRASNCRVENAVVNEDNGMDHPIERLPGDNPLWIGNGAKPSWGDFSDANTTFTTGKSVIPTGWSNSGCIADSPGARALTAASYVDKTNMTRANCIAYCDSQLMPYAGIEFAQECFCGWKLSNGATEETLDASKCASTCSGNKNEDCGGAATLELFTNPAYAVTAASAPPGWTALGCYTDSTSKRTLPKYTFASKKMTYELCTSGCAAKGYSLAGIEYAQECWCANAISGTGKLASDPSTCSMSCAGDKFSDCGGSNRLTVFALAGSKSNATATTANVNTTVVASSTTTPTTLTNNNGASVASNTYTPPYYKH